MRTRSTVLLAALLVAMSSGCGGAAAEGDPSTTEDATPSSDAGADARVDAPLMPQSLKVERVVMLQGVSVPLVDAAAAVDATARVAPVVVGREGMLRVFARPAAGWKPKSITAHLELTAKGKEPLSLDVTRIQSAAGKEADLATTFNFDIPPGFIATDSQWEVTLSDATTTYARFPEAEGLTALKALGSGEQLEVRIVPVKIGGLLPDITAEALETYRSRLYALYPATKVVVDVRETAFEWPSTVEADGTGWGELLDAIVTLRQDDGASDTVYYFGAFKPADRFFKYCDRGCVLGLSGLVSNPADAVGRASIGLGYGDEMSAETLAHEVGHAHGRAHSPCGGVAYPDKSYPYDEGSIGVYGYDVNSKSLLDPNTFTDMMGYCDPTAISDYTFGKLAQRMRAVRDLPKPMAFSPRTYRFVHVGVDGKLTWGKTVKITSTIAGDEIAATVRADDGTETAVTGHYYPYGDLPGGYLLVPEPAARPSKLTLERPLLGKTFVLEGVAATK
ncbi:MAG: M66 family metalloprotease [Polyangiales bacterium]